jgi:glycerol-3-phosphate acyltransferase PlsY
MLLEAASYLSGSLPTAYLMARALKGIDIREHGSGNPGAANVALCVGRGAGIATGLIDAFKGLAPTLAARLLYPDDPRRWILCAGLAIAGHVWPLWLRFRGGKAVATSFGVFLVLSPAAALAGLALWAVITRLTGYSSQGSVAAAGLVLSLTAWSAPALVFRFACGASALIAWRHRENFRRLRSGTEPRL